MVHETRFPGWSGVGTKAEGAQSRIRPASWETDSAGKAIIFGRSALLGGLGEPKPELTEEQPGVQEPEFSEEQIFALDQ